MQDLKDCLVSDESISSSVEEIANDIKNGRVDLVEFVEKLGPFLTATDIEERSRAMNLLSSTLKQIPADFLSSAQLNFISTFYCDRLKDHHSIIPNTLSGIQAIASMKNLADECSARLLQSMFHNVPCQSQVRGDREKIFDILKTFCKNKTEELTRMGSDFVYGFINAMDGERDPRILAFLFDFLPQFLTTFDLGHLSDEMFEVIACYFPVDFNPNANDAAAITRDLLADKLADCLCSHEAFADDCINLLVEKMDSQLSVAKLDSLHLLATASIKFSPEKIEKHFPLIWNALRNELLPGNNKEIMTAALYTVNILLNNVSRTETAAENIVNSISNSIISSLSDVDSRLFIPSAAVALKCAASSRISAKLITTKCLPAFLLQLSQDNSNRNDQRATLIEFSGQLISSCIENECVDQIGSKLIDEAQQEFINGLRESSNVQLLNATFSALAVSVEIISEESRSIVYQSMKKLLLDDNAVDVNVTNALNAFGERYPDEVAKNVVDPLFSIDYIQGKQTLESIERFLTIVTNLISIRLFRNEISNYLTNFIFNRITESVRAQKIALISIKILRKIIENDKNENFRNTLLNDYKIFDRFLDLIHSKKFNATNEVYLTFDDEFLYEMSQIGKTLTISVDHDEQKKLVETYLPALNLQLKTDLYFAMGILGYLDKSIDLENHFEQLITELTNLALNTDDDSVKKIANQLICSLFNKCSDSDHNRNILKKIIHIIKIELQKHNKKAVEILSWISKGLLTRGHKDASEIVDTLIDLLQHPSLAEAAVDAFEIISIELPELHLPVIKHLFKQKLFQICLKKLWHKVEELSEKHLSAFVFVLKLTPHQVLVNNIDKVGLILLKSLTLTKAKTLSASLEICQRFVSEQNEYFRDHLQNLIPQCLKLSVYPDSMNVRITALNILSNCTKYPAFVILPFVQDVLLGLVAPLDDKKRLVRNAAVLTRNHWFTVGIE